MSESNDDRRWLEALRGDVSAAGSDDASHLEGEVLRGALIASRARDGLRVAHGADRAREDALIERAAREGVIPASARQRSASSNRWPQWLAAATLVSFSVGLGLWIEVSRDVVSIERGTGVVLLEVKNAKGLKQQLLGELRAAGVEATGYESLGAEGIDADLPQPLTPRVRRVLEAHRIPAPADGVLRIEIREKE
jgi:hypothetical protein